MGGRGLENKVVHSVPYLQDTGRNVLYMENNFKFLQCYISEGYISQCYLSVGCFSQCAVRPVHSVPYLEDTFTQCALTGGYFS